MATEKRMIDANALIHRIVVERDDIKIKTGCDIGYHNGLNREVSMAINAPTVDAVEVVRGRWDIFRNGIYDFALRLRCSNCGCVVYESGFNYCPNCGAKMDGERKDNE